MCVISNLEFPRYSQVFSQRLLKKLARLSLNMNLLKSLKPLRLLELDDIVIYPLSEAYSILLEK